MEIIHKNNSIQHLNPVQIDSRRWIHSSGEIKLTAAGPNRSGPNGPKAREAISMDQIGEEGLTSCWEAGALGGRAAVWRREGLRAWGRAGSRADESSSLVLVN